MEKQQQLCYWHQQVSVGSSFHFVCLCFYVTDMNTFSYWFPSMEVDMMLTLTIALSVYIRLQNLVNENILLFLHSLLTICDLMHFTDILSSEICLGQWGASNLPFFSLYVKKFIRIILYLTTVSLDQATHSSQEHYGWIILSSWIDSKGSYLLDIVMIRSMIIATSIHVCCTLRVLLIILLSDFSVEFLYVKLSPEATNEIHRYTDVYKLCLFSLVFPFLSWSVLSYDV